MVVEREGTLRNCLKVVEELIEVHVYLANNELKLVDDITDIDDRLDYIGCLCGLRDFICQFDLDNNEYFVRFDLDDFRQ